MIPGQKDICEGFMVWGLVRSIVLGFRPLRAVHEFKAANIIAHLSVPQRAHLLKK